MRAVLIVDDDPDLRATVRATLDDAGYVVWCAANGQEALELLNKVGKPCLILLDLMMPIMNGWQFRRRQLLDERLRDYPVVVMTATGTLAEAAVEADASLRKPITLDDLLTTVDRFCPTSDNDFDEAPATTRDPVPDLPLDLEDSSSRH